MDNIVEHIIRERNGIDLNVYHVGIEKCAPQHHYGPAVRDHDKHLNQYHFVLF